MSVKGEKTKIGYLDCQHCGDPVVVRENKATGALSFPCSECGFPGFAKRSGEQYYTDKLAAVRELRYKATPPPPPAAPAKTKLLFG